MDEINEIRLAEFENRLRALESGQTNQQGQNAQLPGFVPIPQLTVESNGCYEIESYTEQGAKNIRFRNTYVQLAGKLYSGPSSSFAESAVKGKFLVIDANASSASGDTTFQFQTYGSLEALKEAQKDPDHLIIPLYKFDDDGAVECDFRTVPYEWQMNYN